MAKVEVQIRSCFCCGLTPGSILVGLYTLLLYTILLALALWGLSDTATNGDNSYYTSCELEAQGKIRADNRKLTFHEGRTTVIIEDSTSYHCSFGLYTEELKFSQSLRYLTLLFDIFLYVLIVAASVALLIGLCTDNQFLLIPWIVLMTVDIIRGTISVLFIFVLSHGNLARIATGIFFLGLQFLHTSLLLLIIAKFQRVHNRKKGIVTEGDKQYDPRMAYPTNNTLPSNYAYSPQLRHDGHSYPYSDYSPSQKEQRFDGPPYPQQQQQHHTGGAPRY
jgi:hypothetical protein